MSFNSTKTLFTLFIIIGFTRTNAQQWLGRTTGNFSGTYGVYNNASSIADSKYRYYFNFWGRGLNFYNNFLTYNAPMKINQWANNTPEFAQYKDLDGRVMFGQDWLLENYDGREKQFSFNQDIWGPSLMFPISKNWNMAINTRQRSGLQMFGISEDVARMARHGVDSGSTASMQKFGINMQSYQELSFTFAGILAKSEHHQLNGGATVKFLRGLGASYIKGDNLSISGTGANSAMVNGNFDYAYTNDKDITAPFNRPYGLFSLNSKGAGAGIDLGLSYAYTSRHLKYPSNKYCSGNDLRSDYDIKLALAVNDLGGIRYNRQSYLYKYMNAGTGTVIAPSTVLDPLHAASQNGMDSIGRNVFGMLGATRSSGFWTGLPTAINFQADFRFTKGFFTTIYLNQNLRGKNVAGLRATSMLSIIPRIESRGFEFSMPLTLSENYKNYYLGAYARIGPVFFGSDNLGGLLNVASNSGFTGADIYGGVSFGIGNCHKWWYENKVDPVDSIRRDSVYTEHHDTIRLVERDTIKVTSKDTVYIDKKSKHVVTKHDTLYIEKVVRNKADIEKEKELQNREAILVKRQQDLDKREQEIVQKQKGIYNETEVVKNCRTSNTILTEENIVLKSKNTQLENDTATLRKTLADQSKKCQDQKTQNDAEILRLKTEIQNANKRITDLEIQIITLKKGNTTEVVKVYDAEKAARCQKQVDSLNQVLAGLKAQLDRCNKNTVQNNADVVRKAQEDKNKAENDAKIARRQADSLVLVLAGKKAELETCKKNFTLTSTEIIKKAEADKAKAENDARIARRQSDSLALVLAGKNAELDICKKNSTVNNAEIVKKAETDKAKAENNARLANRRADSLAQVLAGKTAELDLCKKSSTQNNADVVKKSEQDKNKAENEAKLASRRADSLAQILTVKLAELDNCKKSSTQNDAEAAKKKCEDENTRLKAEMASMSKTIGSLNTRNSALSYRVDSLFNELKNCSKSGGSGDNNAELLKKCQDANNDLNNQITHLKAVITAKDKSLDSAENVISDLGKKQTDLNAQIVKLNTDINDLKAKSSGSNCDELQKQLDDKNAENTKLKADNTTLQAKVTTLTNQLNEYKNEYNFLVKQNQKCNQKLDSCMKGLYNDGGTPGTPGGSGEGHGDGGSGGNDGSMNVPAEGSNGSRNDSTSEAAKKVGRVLEIGGGIINALEKTQASKNSTGSQGGSKPSNTNNKPSETQTSGNSGTQSGTSSSGSSGNSGSSGGSKPSETGTSNNGGGRTSSGNGGSARRR